jgi:hypothetical protein
MKKHLAYSLCLIFPLIGISQGIPGYFMHPTFHNNVTKRYGSSD